MGNDGVKPHFQWFWAKNKKAAQKGKYKHAGYGAEISADKPGYYYCVVKSGETVLQTRTTLVK